MVHLPAEQGIALIIWLHREQGVARHLTSSDSDEVGVADFNDVVPSDRLSVLLIGVHNEWAYAAPRCLHITTANCTYTPFTNRSKVSQSVT